MSIKPPARWTPRSLTAMFLPHLFRSSRNSAESTGARKEKVPLDAHDHHMFITRKTDKMIKAMRSEFALDANRPADAPKDGVWSIATGGWVPRHDLKLAYIFPLSLGPMVAQEVCHRINLRGAHNGLLVPPTVREALDEWALTIVPEQRFRREMSPRSYLFRTLDSEAKSLRKPVWPDSKMDVRDLDGERLLFRSRSNARPSPHACYFHSCCAMWKSTFLEDPERRAEDFWERFQLRMNDLWGNVAAKRPILNIFKPPELAEVEEKNGETSGTRDGSELLFLNEAMGQEEDKQEEYDDGDDDDGDIDFF